MLQQGLDVADIAFFIGEDTPKMTGLLEPACPPGKTRQWDLINAEVLRETAGVDEKGRLSLPHGTKYEVLVLPRLGTTMRPEMLRTIERLVNDGAFVLGPKPLRSPSLAGQPRADEEVREIADRLWGDVDGKSKLFRRVGKGVIAWNLPYDDIFAMRKSPEDCAFRAETPVDFSHRTLPNAEIYFLANRANGKTADRFVFRTAGRIPELWRPVTGEMREAPEWRATRDGRTEVRVELEPMESVDAQNAMRRSSGRRGSSRAHGSWSSRAIRSTAAPPGRFAAMRFPTSRRARIRRSGTIRGRWCTGPRSRRRNLPPAKSRGCRSAAHARSRA